jgi:tetratricopeptide (TPR) repeat protein
LEAAEATKTDSLPWVRVTLFGLVAGALFPALHVPPGLSWTELPSPREWTLAAFAVAPWLAIAVSVHPARRAFRPAVSLPWLAFSALLGFLLWGGLITTHFRPESRVGFALLFLAGSLALWTCAGAKAAKEPDAPHDPALARLGLVLAAAGACLALGNLHHHVRLVGLGTPEESALVSAVLIALVALGMISFGGLFASPALARPLLAVGLVGAAVGALYGLHLLDSMQGDALYAYFKRFGLDLSQVGMLVPTALLAAAALVVPGLLLGAALRSVRDARWLAPVVWGAALGTLLCSFLPALLSGGPKPPDAATWSWSVALAGICLAALGALLFLLAGTGRARAIAMLLCVAAAAGAISRPRFAFTSFSTWYPAPIRPDIVLPTPLGMLTVEPYVDGTRIVTLDRRRLTPIQAEEDADNRRILRALGTMPPVEGRALRLLVIGQLTPARSEFLKLLGPLDVEYTAPWYPAFRAIEDRLFPLDRPPIGKAIAPAQAERRIADGSYDLVLVLPVHGAVIVPKSQTFIPWGNVEEPVLGALEVPERTTAVAWIDALSPLARCQLGERVLYTADRFLRPTIGVVRGAVREEPTEERPAFLRGGAGEPRPATWELLSTLPRERAFPLHASIFRRLKRANADGPEADLAHGLDLHFGAQTASSPFESLPQQIEFDEQELQAFQKAGLRPHLDATTREVWEDEAWLLTEKREPNLVVAYMEALAQAHGPWTALERALARAFEELLEPEDALAYYDRFLMTSQQLRSYDLNDYRKAADLALDLGDPARAIDFARQGLSINPRRDIEMRLCKALLHLGDPAGEELLAKLRPELSEEDQRWILGGIGPQPPPVESPSPTEEGAIDSGGE